MKKEKRELLAFFVFPVSLFVLQGCTLLGVAAYQVAGPPPVPAKYTPEQRPMLVLVENYQRESTARVNADLLARDIVDELSMHNVAPLVPLETLAQLRETHKDFATMSITAIGEAAGAWQVLYVQIVHDDVTPLAGGYALQGQTLVRLKVVNVASGNTMWPRDLSEGYEISTSTQLDKEKGNDPRDIHQRLDSALAVEIGKLFYKWKPDF